MEIGPGRVQDSGSEEWAFKNAYVAPCGDASESKLQKLGGGPELSVEPHRPDRHTQCVLERDTFALCWKIECF